MMSFAKWIDDYCPVNPRQVMSFSAAAERLVCNAAVHHKSSVLFDAGLLMPPTTSRTAASGRTT